ncbi:MAG: class I SAM-dependent methyltransferase [bacterium]|nr:class I SAM-dependent methyltransferase [bacterium]
MAQDDVFKKQEADQWFLRNEEYLNNAETVTKDVPLQLVKKNSVAPQRVLEVGAANGFRLDELHKRYKSAVTGLELSNKAIAQGKKQFPAITFVQGSADKLPFADGAFDMVIINFVLHWVDRKNLLRAVSELDRVLADKGFLIIGDFYPDTPGKFPYKHTAGDAVFTYTQQYQNIFTATHLYSVIDSVYGDHRTKKMGDGALPDNRMGFFLLQKNVDIQYQKRSV